MAIPHAASNQVVSVEPLGPDLATTKTWTLIKTEQMQVIRLVVPAGKVIPGKRPPARSPSCASKAGWRSRHRGRRRSLGRAS